MKNGGNKQYFPDSQNTVNIQDSIWLQTIYDTNLLSDLFDELSLHTEFYLKTEHSIIISERLITNNPQSVKDLLELLYAVLKEAKNS